MVRHKSRKRNAVLSVGLVGSALLAAVALTGCGGGNSNSGVTLDANLNGAQEVPPVTTTATGSATVNLNVNNSTIRVVLNTSGLTNVIAAHIHVGAPGEEGQPIFTLYQPADGDFPATLTKTLTAADFTPAPGVPTFTDAMGVIRGGSAYINVHTTANPEGEIRGQIEP